jgi:predicted anti-sigma-YlaC factor YlaD
LTQAANLLATLVGFGWVTAFLVQLLKRESWPSSVKLVIAIVFSALVGLAAAWLTGDVTRFVTFWRAGTVTAEQAITFGVLIFTAAQTWYVHYFKGQTWAVQLGAWPKAK